MMKAYYHYGKKINLLLLQLLPNPNRSHFMAMDQWSGFKSGMVNGCVSDEIKNDKYLLSLGPTGSNAVEGSKVNFHF